MKGLWNLWNSAVNLRDNSTLFQSVLKVWFALHAAPLENAALWVVCKLNVARLVSFIKSINNVSARVRVSDTSRFAATEEINS